MEFREQFIQLIDFSIFTFLDGQEKYKKNPAPRCDELLFAERNSFIPQKAVFIKQKPVYYWPWIFYSAVTAMQLEAQSLDHFHHRGELRVAFGGQRLV